MRAGVLENVTTLICFTGLVAYTNNYMLFIIMIGLIIWFSSTGLSMEDGK